MIIRLLTILTALLCQSCTKPATDPAPLSLIPAGNKIITKVNVKESLKIAGLGKRLRYEQKRKPTLQILPIDNIVTLYQTSGSGQETENQGGLYIIILDTALKLDDVIKEYAKKFADDKEVLLGQKEFNGQSIHTIRDKKQELAICQVGPKTYLGGPLSQIINSLECGEDNIANNKVLQNYLAGAKDDAMSLFILSAKDSGTLLQSISLFDTLAIKVKSLNQGAEIIINADCADEETATKTISGFTLLRTFLIYSKSDIIKPNDIVITQNKKQAQSVAKLSKEAMAKLFEKD